MKISRHLLSAASKLWVLSISGLLCFFLFQMISEYCKWEMITNFVLEDVVDEPIPSISLCYPGEGCFTDDVWKGFHSRNETMHLAIRDYLKQVILIRDGKFLDYGLSPSNVKPFEIIVNEEIKGDEPRRCLMMEFRRESIPEEIRIWMGSGPVDLNCFGNFTSRPEDQTHPRNQLLVIGSSTIYPTIEDLRRSLSLPHGYSVIIAVKVTEIERLKTPYETDCVDYSDHKITHSQSHCLENCLLKGHKNYYDWHPKSMAKLNISLKFGNRSLELGDKYSECSKVECTQRRIVIEGVTWSNQVTYWAYVKFERKLEKTILLPRISLPTLIIYCFSAVASVFGIAVVNVKQVINHLLRLVVFNPEKNFIANALKLALTLLCLAGATWQSYGVIEVYWNRETITEVTLGSPSGIRRPNIHVCLDISIILKPGSPDYLKTFGYQNPRAPENITAAELNAHLLSPHEIIEEIYVTEKDEVLSFNGEKLRSLMEMGFVREYFRSNRKCLELIVDLVTNEHFDDRSTHEWFSISLLPNIINSTSPSDQVDTHVNGIYDEIDTVINPKMKNHIYFSVIQTVNLPKPYASACRDYASEGIISIHDCILKNWFSILSENGSKIFGWLATPTDSNHSFTNIMTPTSRPRDRCREEPCEEVKISLENFFFPRGKNIKYFTPSDTKKIIMLPKTTFFDVLFQVHQDIGTWFGFHMLILMSHIEKLKDLNCFKKCFSKPEYVVRLIQSFLVTISLIGFTYTSYISIYEYFRFETVVQSSIQQSRYFGLPTISFGIVLHFAYHREKWSDFKSAAEFYEKMSETNVTDIIENCSKFSDLVEEFSYMDSKLNIHEYHWNSSDFDRYVKNHVTVFFMRGFIFFQMTLPEARYDRYELLHHKYYSRTLFNGTLKAKSFYAFRDTRNVFEVKLKNELNPNGICMFISAHGYLLEDPLNLYWKQLIDPARGAGDLSRYEYSRLPSPYKTNCFEYGENDYYSRMGCYENCINEHYVEKFNKRNPNIITYPSSNTLIAFNVWSVDRKFTKSCESRCSRPACHEVYYKPTVAYNLRNYYISVLKEEIKEIHYPKVTTTEFVVNILGNVGFWFGVCLSSFSVEMFLHIFTRIKLKLNFVVELDAEESPNAGEEEVNDVGERSPPAPHPDSLTSQGELASEVIDAIGQGIVAVKWRKRSNRVGDLRTSTPQSPSTTTAPLQEPATEMMEFNVSISGQLLAENSESIHPNP